MPVFGPEEFAKKVSVQMPTANVRLGEQTVACQTFVTTQCQGLIVSGMLQSPTSLVPLQELGLPSRCAPRGGRTKAPASAVYLSHFAATSVPGSPWPFHCRGRGASEPGRSPGISEKSRWHLIPSKLFSQKQFQHNSLHVTGTRAFVLQNKRGAFKVEKFVPDLKGYVRIAPCFYVASSERGMAGKCILQVRAQVKRIPPRRYFWANKKSC